MPDSQPNESGEKGKEKVKRKSYFAPLAAGVLFFVFVLILGIISAKRVVELAGKAGTAPEMGVADFILIFFLATLFFLFVVYSLKFHKLKKILFRVVFLLAVFTGSMIFFPVWFNEAVSLVFGLTLVLLWLLYPTILVQDGCMLSAALGAGLFLGFVFSPETVAALLVIFSAYDLIAVYLTKHMVAMAKEMMSAGALAAVFIPPAISGLNERIGNVAAGGEKYLILGGGDIIFPLVFCVSLARSGGFFDPWIVALFSAAGFLTSLCLFTNQKERRPIPALPAIAIFSILGYLLTFFA